MKRVVCLFVLLFTLLPLCFISVSATVYEGLALDKKWILENYTGKNMTDEEIEAVTLADHYRVRYTLDTETGVLRIFCDTDESGNKIEQAMLPYADFKWLPWRVEGMKDSIKTVYIEEGVQSVGRYSFYECTTLQEVYIPYSVRKIDRSTFYQCSSLQKVHYAGSEEDFWKRVNLDEVRNWYAVDLDGDGVERDEEIKYYLKDKLVFGESVKVVCKNEEGDEITSFGVGGYERGDEYTVTPPVLEGLTYVGEKSEITGKFKKNDDSVIELIYRCDHEYEVSDPSIPCGSFCKKCGRQDPDSPVAHTWSEVEVRSERGFLTPLQQSVSCEVCGAKQTEYKMAYAPIVCVCVAAPVLLAGIVFAIVYPIRRKKKMKDMTW